MFTHTCSSHLPSEQTYCGSLSLLVWNHAYSLKTKQKLCSLIAWDPHALNKSEVYSREEPWEGLGTLYGAFTAFPSACCSHYCCLCAISVTCNIFYSSVQPSDRYSDCLCVLVHCNFHNVPDVQEHKYNCFLCIFAHAVLWKKYNTFGNKYKCAMQLQLISLTEMNKG